MVVFTYAAVMRNTFIATCISFDSSVFRSASGEKRVKTLMMLVLGGASSSVGHANSRSSSKGQNLQYDVNG